MNDARNLLKFIKLAAPAPPSPKQAPSTPLNPVQIAVQQQQAAAMGDGMPQGNPDILKAQEGAAQAQQEASQQIAKIQQQSQEAVMQAQQQAQQAKMQAMQQSQGVVTKLQDQLDAARTEVVKAKAEAEIASLEARKAELFKPEAPKPEPVAPGPDYKPTLRRMSTRIGKALARLEKISPHLKMAGTPVITLGADGNTVDIDARHKPHKLQDSPGYNNPAAGNIFQEAGYHNDAVLNLPEYRVDLGDVGNKGYKMLRNMLIQRPDPTNRQHGFFEPSNIFDNGLPNYAMPPQMPWWSGVKQTITQGLNNPYTY